MQKNAALKIPAIPQHKIRPFLFRQVSYHKYGIYFIKTACAKSLFFIKSEQMFLTR
jgi:hypothetical protein